ncbi:MAG TPA: galactose/methyl galactoside ABC transporter permease MglC [Oligoflexus sp.]|uniref:galactose/methyl galactoside ABC transporter permease MglC n=1 Tax=Oligoflexus sp. TaxID=1971216 RepID=UPI002D7F7B99|nr:galactose/methyl galactoside ABC transporter permease MglC [Oligoflexus sp.]HET9241643.1 galactose/methyl galactoside ABC transporter permease MglC [Oligoflexus sp.]
MMNSFQKRILTFLLENAIYVVLVLLVAGISIQDPNFLSFGSLRNILLSSSTKLILALGSAMVLISGGVDLSAGRVVGFAAVLSASMLQIEDYPRRFYPALSQLPLLGPILLALALGAVIGALNGLAVAKLRIPPFIATLGSMVIVFGLNLIYFDQEPNNSQPIGGLRPDFTDLGSGAIFGMPIIVLIAAAVFGIAWILFNKTLTGKSMYAIGGNREAARVSGINVDATLIRIYATASALAALAGILEAARSGGAKSNYGEMYELDAIAACVVGGVSTSGGIGTVPGVLAGVLIFSVINYGLTFIGMNPNLQFIVKGLIIITAVAIDVRKYWQRS